VPELRLDDDHRDGPLAIPLSDGQAKAARTGLMGLVYALRYAASPPEVKASFRDEVTRQGLGLWAKTGINGVKRIAEIAKTWKRPQ